MQTIRGFLSDQRKVSKCLVNGCIIVGLSAWVLVSMAVAQSLPENADSPVRTSDLLRFQWYTISGLIGLVGILIGFFIVRELNGAKSNIRSLWKEKMSVEEHEKIDHSLLCAVCRSKNGVRP